MSALLHMFSGELRIEVDNEDGCIWIRQPFGTVSLTLTADDRAKLRAALDQADAAQHQEAA